MCFCQTFTEQHLKTFDQPCRAVLVEVNRRKNAQNLDEEVQSYLTCELPSGRFYRIPSVDFEFIKSNFIEGQYKSAGTLMSFGPGVMLDVNKHEIVIPVGNKPILSHMRDNDYKAFGRMPQKIGTNREFSVLVVRVVTNVSISSCL